MVNIRINNDVPIRWHIKHNGEDAILQGKELELKVCNTFGCTAITNYIIDGSELSFVFSGSAQKYLGDYHLTLKIKDGNNVYTVDACKAFRLVALSCKVEDNAIVEVESNITVPRNGFSAYELAVLNGEYTGDYEGYQRWLARYAESTANDAVNIANEAKENSSTALSTAQQARVVANDAKTAVATKQDTLTLTVKDNGNIVIGNIQGQTKEFMPATPSGDPNHYMYEQCGAVWNGKTGYWELNGLTDMTNEDMQESYITCNMYSDILLSPAKYMNKSFRTNILGNIEMSSTLPVNSAQQIFRGSSKLEILNFNFKPSGSETPLYIFSNMDYCFYRCNALRSILGSIKCTNANFTEAFKGCKSLTNIKLLNVSKAISFADSPNLSRESLLYLINNAGTASFTITLHADAYANASADEDIQAALAIKTNITLESA